MAGSNAAPVFEPAEPDLYAVSASVLALCRNGYARSGISDRGCRASLNQSASQPRSPSSPGQAVQQGRSTGVVADVACCHEEADRTPICMGHGLQLGVHAALGASNQSPDTPLLPSGSKPCGALSDRAWTAERPSIVRMKRPASLVS